jgi:iron complex transport system permease protein
MNLRNQAKNGVSLGYLPMKTIRAIALVSLLTALFVLNLSLGSVRIPFSDILTILMGKPAPEAAWTDIIWDFRMTKALTCLLAGGALAVSGLQMQTLFRNALVGPDVLGLSSGASLAVSVLLLSQSAGLFMFIIPGAWTVALASSVGCIGVFVIMLTISQRLHDNVSLLLVGLMIGAATSSVVSVLQYLSKAEDLQMFVIWTFGSLGSLSWAEIKILCVLFFVGLVIALTSIKSLNAWLLGENYARSIGVNIRQSRFLIIFSASVLTGSVTAFCGPIAFVGLAVPHLVKLLIPTSNHKILIPAVMVGGASLMLFCDILTQLPGNAQMLPINAITALIGAPVVIWVITRNKTVAV